MRENPPTWVWIAVALALASLGAVAVVKRDKLTDYVTGLLTVKGHDEPLRVVANPGAKGMVA
jgi:hypothetical protein